jgi:DNA-binding winged helix-turn-helix (wHTH) protein
VLCWVDYKVSSVLRELSSKIRSKILKVILKVFMSNEINNLYKFGNFKFDTKKGKLWRENELILISPKATELLALLLEKKGEFIDKQEIFETVWKDTFVEDGVLTQNIYTLRKALGNDADGLPIIENKTRLGYRITVPIVCEGETGGHADTEISAQSTEVYDNNSVQQAPFPASPRLRVAVPVLTLLAITIFQQSSTFIFANQLANRLNPLNLRNSQTLAI